MRKPVITMPANLPAAALLPTGQPAPAVGDNSGETEKLPPLPDYSAADLPAAWKASVAVQKATDSTAVDTRKQTKREVKIATRNLMLLTARMARADKAFNAETVCIEINGAPKVAEWNKRTKAVRFAEWNAVINAARGTDRVNEDLWTLADTKEKFVKACQMLNDNKTVEPAAIETALKPKKAGPLSDGQKLANAIAALSAIADLNVIAALADTIEGLEEFKAQQNALGLLLDDEQVEKAAKAAADGAPPVEMDIRAKIALARARAATVQ